MAFKGKSLLPTSFLRISTVASSLALLLPPPGRLPLSNVHMLTAFPLREVALCTVHSPTTALPEPLELLPLPLPPLPELPSMVYELLSLLPPKSDCALEKSAAAAIVVVELSAGDPVVYGRSCGSLSPYTPAVSDLRWASQVWFVSKSSSGLLIASSRMNMAPDRNATKPVALPSCNLPHRQYRVLSGTRYRTEANAGTLCHVRAHSS